MTKAKTKTTGRNADAEDKLHDKLSRATALVHLMAQAADTMGADPAAFHLGLEAVWDLLIEAEDARQEVSAVLENVEWPKPPQPEPKPISKATGKAIIATVKKAMRPGPRKKANGLAASIANNTDGGEQAAFDSLLGGGAQ